MFVLLIQFVVRGCAAITITTTPTDLEDLSQFSREIPACPGLIGWPQVQTPISCNDPACRGLSWAVPPYRCRQPGGVMFAKEVFGCRCCPRLIDCDDPACAGSSSEEICRSELLEKCVCVSSRRRTSAPLTHALLDAATVAQVQGELADLTLYESLDNVLAAITPSSWNCPREPPVRCLDPQCRGADDWKTETSSTPRCNQTNGKLVVDGTETALHDCPCCPEYIHCSSTDCNGGANQVCTSVPLHGCFCDWPSRGPTLMAVEPPRGEDDPPYVYVNDIDAFFYDSNHHSLSVQTSPTAAISFTASPSMVYDARPLATQRETAPALAQNFTWMSLPSRRREGFSLSQNGSVFVVSDHFKHT